MTDPIATLRRYTSILPTTLARSTAAEAVDALEAELTALRENALDLSRVPEGFKFHALELWGDDAGTFWCALAGPRWPAGPFATGTGPTPSTALSAAIERAKESK